MVIREKIARIFDDTAKKFPPASPGIGHSIGAALEQAAELIRFTTGGIHLKLYKEWVDAAEFKADVIEMSGALCDSEVMQQDYIALDFEVDDYHNLQAFITANAHMHACAEKLMQKGMTRYSAQRAVIDETVKPFKVVAYEF